MKKNGLILLAASLVLLFSCNQEEQMNSVFNQKELSEVSSDGITLMNIGNIEDFSFDGDSLSPEETEGLLWMREEEKLAHDVFAFLFEKWELPVFDRISSSETTHTRAIKILLDGFGIEDTALPESGQFTNSSFQVLYDSLVVLGSVSEIEAFKVGVKVEELDIYDLENELSSATNEYIIRVYENLLRASRNHLRAFYRNLESYGESYEPEFLPEETFNAIISSDFERGNMARRGNRSGYRGKGQGHKGGSGMQGQGNGDGSCLNN